MTDTLNIYDWLDVILGVQSPDNGYDPEYWEIVEEQKSAIVTHISSELTKARISELETQQANMLSSDSQWDAMGERISQLKAQLLNGEQKS